MMFSINNLDNLKFNRKIDSPAQMMNRDRNKAPNKSRFNFDSPPDDFGPSFCKCKMKP